ncbi:MAG: transcriptional repressor [Oscillospiraceae bacterium]|nr:transcriptional repressor [Oscillospiraceae bacterium]
MEATRKSKQRDAILQELQGRRDHPTAEELYFALKDRWPALSLGTIYRNLTQFCQTGQAQRLPGRSAEHFDATVQPHAHVLCLQCGRMSDLSLPPPLFDELQQQAEAEFPGELLEIKLQFNGICAQCAAIPQKAETPAAMRQGSE